MKSSLRKLRGLASTHRQDPKERIVHLPPTHLDDLNHASQDMLDMRNCYDSLLSAAAATANSAYEFSEALHEMGTCLEKTALNDDEVSGRALFMLGKTQFELQKLVDSYRVHVIQTITKPSESILKELETVEEMKQQCDGKRDYYKLMLDEHKEKGKSRNTKGESLSSRQLKAAQEDYDEEATLFLFRLKSLKQGQPRSLLTQATRHHAAQLNFFRKGVKSLEIVEPHVKVLAEQQHIDYQFSGLEDDGTEDDDYISHSCKYDGELSFDCTQSDQAHDVDSQSRSSMELDQLDLKNAPTSSTDIAKENLNRSQEDLLSFNRGSMPGSHSAPIIPEKKFEPSERIQQMRSSPTRKFRTYVLPTPVDAKMSEKADSAHPVSGGRAKNMGGWPTQLWHSSPLEPNKFVKDLRDDKLSSPTRLPTTHSVLKESNINSGPIKLPPPVADGLSLPQSSLVDSKKIKRQAFSGPLTNNAWSSQPFFSAVPAYGLASQRPVSPKVSPSASPPPILSPNITELHALPRPPSTSEKNRPLVGYSAPLVSRGKQHYTTSKPSTASYKASPLPTPPGAITRSFSIPSSDRRRPISMVADLSEVPHNQNVIADISSPPLTPILLTSTQTASAASESVHENRNNLAIRMD